MAHDRGHISGFIFIAAQHAQHESGTTAEQSTNIRSCLVAVWMNQSDVSGCERARPRYSGRKNSPRSAFGLPGKTGASELENTINTKIFAIQKKSPRGINFVKITKNMFQR